MQLTICMSAVTYYSNRISCEKGIPKVSWALGKLFCSSLKVYFFQTFKPYLLLNVTHLLLVPHVNQNSKIKYSTILFKKKLKYGTWNASAFICFKIFFIWKINLAITSTCLLQFLNKSFYKNKTF